MGSICERISVKSRIVFEIFDHICGPFIYAYHNSKYDKSSQKDITHQNLLSQCVRFNYIKIHSWYVAKAAPNK